VDQKTILIIEDEIMIQMLWEDICVLANIKIGGTAMNSTSALQQLKETAFDIVVLDVNLTDGPSESVALWLKETNIPVIVSTGEDPRSLPEAYHSFHFIHKPFRPSQMIDAIQQSLGAESLSESRISTR
jgi:DNA-binding NtrC family response regulator